MLILVARLRGSKLADRISAIPEAGTWLRCARWERWSSSYPLQVSFVESSRILISVINFLALF